MTARLKPIHPGEILQEEFMAPLGLSPHQLARLLRVPVTRIGEIVRARRSLSSDTALRLARLFGTTPEFWVNLQAHFDLATARQRGKRRIEGEVQPLRAARRHSAAAAS
ncbi:MAG: HigA family addiction module antitoxin [Terriglobales bacterium]